MESISREIRTMIFLLFLLPLASGLSREVMVVTSTDEVQAEPRVLEIFDFDSRRWRAVEKASAPLSAAEFKRLHAGKSMKRPGFTARLVEDHSVLQYELRNGLAMELASYPETLAGSATIEYGDTFCLVGGWDEEARVVMKTVICWNPLQSKLQVRTFDS